MRIPLPHSAKRLRAFRRMREVKRGPSTRCGQGRAGRRSRARARMRNLCGASAREVLRRSKRDLQQRPPPRMPSPARKHLSFQRSGGPALTGSPGTVRLGVCSHGEAKNHDRWVAKRSRQQGPRLDNPSLTAFLTTRPVAKRLTIRDHTPCGGSLGRRISGSPHQAPHIGPIFVHTRPRSLCLTCTSRSLVGNGRNWVNFCAT